MGKGTFNYPDSLAVRDIEGNAAAVLAVTGTAADVDDLSEGVYAIWSDVDCWIKIHPTDASNVTVANGYFIDGGATPVPFFVRNLSHLGGIAGGACNISYHKVA